MYNMKIPGTHDAASYNFASQGMDYFGKTQTQTITEQLNSGMRSFDLRVQKVTNSLFIPLMGVSLNSYYVTHGALVVGSSITLASPASTPVLLTSVLAEFRAFSDSHRNEVIILNFHRVTDSAQTSLAS